MSATVSIDYWINELGKYSFEQLTRKPSVESWSMGQLYTHLLLDTRFYLAQVKTCTVSDANADQPLTEKGRNLLLHGFPDLQIVGHPDNSRLPQPQSVTGLLDDMIQLKYEVEQAIETVAKTHPKGKSCHPDPGIGYFRGDEWLQFAKRHFEHHLKQKKRIDDFLGA